MFEQIKEMIVEELGVEESQVTESVSFKDDLGADSLDVLEIVMGIEDEFGIKVPTEATGNIVTVGDAFEAIKKALQQERILNTMKALWIQGFFVVKEKE